MPSSDDEEDIFYDAIDEDLLSPRRPSSTAKRMYGIANSCVERMSGLGGWSGGRVVVPEQMKSPSVEGREGLNGILPVPTITVDTAGTAPSIASSSSSISSGDPSIGSTLQSSTNILRTLELTSTMRSQRVKVRTKGKWTPFLAHLHHTQQLSCDGSAVYAMAFSPDGMYLAAGGGDGRVRVWRGMAEDVLEVMEGDPGYVGPEQSVAVFSPEPCQVLLGHEGEILDLSWSSNNFLLSASTDCTVRLWSPSRPTPLAIFPHPDICTSVAFHPTSTHLFISGCFDCRLRLWNIQDGRVQAWNELPPENVVTAVGWDREGRMALAGSSTGVLLFFELEGFKYYTQILVKSTRGKNSVGKKICSIALKPSTAQKNSSSDTILVASNDSRLRSYSLRDKSESQKYLGHSSPTAHLPASYSPDARLLISGSEDGRCYIWLADQDGARRCEQREYVQVADSSVVCTTAMFVPDGFGRKLVAAGMRRPPSTEDPADGRIFVVGDTKGRIRVFENSIHL